jgi:hypothetical protein
VRPFGEQVWCDTGCQNRILLRLLLPICDFSAHFKSPLVSIIFVTSAGCDIQGLFSALSAGFIVVEEIDGVLFDVSALVIVLDDYSDVLVPCHALHLAVGGPSLTRG